MCGVSCDVGLFISFEVVSILGLDRLRGFVNTSMVVIFFLSLMSLQFVFFYGIEWLS